MTITVFNVKVIKQSIKLTAGIVLGLQMDLFIETNHLHLSPHQSGHQDDDEKT